MSVWCVSVSECVVSERVQAGAFGAGLVPPSPEESGQLVHDGHGEKIDFALAIDSVSE